MRRRRARSVPVVLIAEMLLLVAVDDRGHAPVGSDAFVKVGLAGALLAELAVGGQLTIGDDGTVRTADTRPAEELLADVYDAVRNHLEGRKAKQVISGLSRHIGGSRDRVVDRLVGTGVLVAAPQSFLVCSHNNLLDGEAACARRWGMTLGAASKTRIQDAPEGART